MLTPDLTQVGPIPPGTYPAKIVEANARSSQKGNPMCVASFMIDVNGVERDKDAFLVVTGKAARQFFQLLRAVGFNDLADAYSNPATAASAPPFDETRLVGLSCRVVIDADTYNDAPSEKFVAFLPAE